MTFAKAMKKVSPEGPASPAHGWPSALAVARKKLRWAAMNVATSSVISVCQPPRASIAA